jgi:hypothetical protein
MNKLLILTALVFPVPMSDGRRTVSKVFCVRTEQSVWVQCLRCGHVGVLTAETLSRLSLAPSTPIAAFVKRLPPRAEVRV